MIISEKLFLINEQNRVTRLSKKHWKIIIALRNYHTRNNFCPLMSVISEKTKIPMQEIKNIFPDLSVAYILAGFKPPECI